MGFILLFDIVGHNVDWGHTVIFKIQNGAGGMKGLREGPTATDASYVETVKDILYEYCY